MPAKKTPADEKRGPQRDRGTDAVIELTLEDFGEEVPRAAPPPLAPALQRRRFTRVPYVTLARVSVAGVTQIARIEDVSEGGVRIRVAHAVQIGSPVAVVFALPITGDPWELTATVRWTQPVGAHHALGLEFDALDGPARETIVRYVTVMSAFEV